jgi:hypothetical protein
VGFTTIAGTIPEANVILVSPKTTSAQDQLYTFQIKLAHPIPENGKVVLTLPS